MYVNKIFSRLFCVFVYCASSSFIFLGCVRAALARRGASQRSIASERRDPLLFPYILRVTVARIRLYHCICISGWLMNDILY